MRKFGFIPSPAMFSLALLFNAAFSLNLMAATEFYRWVDENGVQHFSQQPPTHLPGLQAVDINGLPLVSGGEPAETASTQEPATAAVEKQIERVENPEKDAEKCDSARHNIAQIEQHRQVRTKDPETGEFIYLSDEEKEIQLKNWLERQSTYC